MVTRARSDTNMIIHPILNNPLHTFMFSSKQTCILGKGLRKGEQGLLKEWAACRYLLNVCLYLCIYTHKTHYTCYIFLYVLEGCMKKSTKIFGLAEEGWSKSSKHSSCDSTQCLVITVWCPVSILPTILEAVRVRSLEARILRPAWEAQRFNLRPPKRKSSYRSENL